MGYSPEDLWTPEELRQRADKLRNFDTAVFVPTEDNEIIQAVSQSICELQMDWFMETMYNIKVEDVKCIQDKKAAGIYWTETVHGWLSVDRAEVEAAVEK